MIFGQVLIYSLHTVSPHLRVIQGKEYNNEYRQKTEKWAIAKKYTRESRTGIGSGLTEISTKFKMKKIERLYNVAW